MDVVRGVKSSNLNSVGRSPDELVSKKATNRRDKYHIRLDGNIIRYLNKNTWRHRGGGGYKYFVNCDHLASHPDLLQLQSFVYYKDHIAILHAAVTDPNIVDQEREVIIKIDFRHDTVQKEYDMGEVMFRNHIPGFIRYICVFSCYDTTNKDIQKVDASKTLKRTLTFPTKQYLPTQICQAEPNEDDKENVLIMPYFPEGSIENYEWTEDNIQLLLNLLIHMILSLAVAFDKTNFVHNDLHLGNILLKTTSKKEITYTFKPKSHTTSNTNHTKTKRTMKSLRTYTRKSRDVRLQRDYPLFGYQPVIMDFGKSKIESDVNNSKFWDNIYFLCTKIVTLRSNTDNRKTTEPGTVGDEASHKPRNYFIDWDWDEVKKYIIQCIRENTPCTAVIPLIRIIETSSLRYVDISDKMPAYNPNIV